MFFQNLAFILPSFQWFLLKRMLLVSHKLVFIKREAVLLSVSMWERAKAFAATIYCVILWYSFCHYKVQFLWCTFQMNVAMETRHFEKVVLRKKLLLSLLSFICDIANIGVWKYVFTRIVIKIFFFHSCRSCSTRVTLVSYSCRLFRIRVARIWHSCCKIG